MIKLKNLLAFLILFSNYLYCQSYVVKDVFFSKSLKANRSVNVYLPMEYDSTNSNIRYPVIYFLHGGGGNHDSYNFIVPILDSLIFNKIINKMIIVKPDGSCPPYLGSQYMNSALYGNFEDYISKDLIVFIDSKYNTIPTSSARCIMGHSMGGEGSMRIALQHPDQYAAVASHSGVLNMEFLDFLAPLVLAENDTLKDISPTTGWMSEALFTASGGYVPNLNNPPYFVDLPINKCGEKIDSVLSRWRLNDPTYLASQYDPKNGLNIFLDCGNEDAIFESTTVFIDMLNSKKIPYEFHSYIGGHNNKLKERFPISLKFFNRVMDKNSK
jgi:enterochelin esterase-like enzyme